MSIHRVFRENKLSVGVKYDSESTSLTGISRASIFAILVKFTLKASALSSALFIVLAIISFDLQNIDRLTILS